MFIEALLHLGYILLGGWCLGDAITEFKKGKYKSFGYNLMIFISSVILLTNLLLCM